MRRGLYVDSMGNHHLMFSISRPTSILGTDDKYTKLQSNSTAMNKANQQEKEKEIGGQGIEHVFPSSLGWVQW